MGKMEILMVMVGPTMMNMFAAPIRMTIRQLPKKGKSCPLYYGCCLVIDILTEHDAAIVSSPKTKNVAPDDPGLNDPEHVYDAGIEIGETYDRQKQIELRQDNDRYTQLYTPALGNLLVRPGLNQICRPDQANAVRAGAAVAFLRPRHARCVKLPRLRLRCSGKVLRDLDPAYMNPGSRPLLNQSSIACDS